MENLGMTLFGNQSCTHMLARENCVRKFQHCKFLMLMEFS